MRGTLLIAVVCGTLVAYVTDVRGFQLPGTVDQTRTIDQSAWMATWTNEGHRLTPTSKQAWLTCRKSQALDEISSMGKSLPEDFLTWVDEDPVVRDTVYGARRNPASVLLMLRSLELDLGVQAVRHDYTQLALAMAVVHAAKGVGADLSARPPLKLVIPGDPRSAVNTQAASRILDRNDHIINFLNSITIEEEVVIGHKEEPPPLRYDEHGVAIPTPKGKLTKVPITEKQTRTLFAADVIANRDLQQRFNQYMQEHGEDVSIDCGDRVVHWKSTAPVRAERKAIREAFDLFRTAYEEKGLLPKTRDPFPTPAESAAWLIRNDQYVFPDDVAANRKWPRYPLNAPWPTLTLLAADNQPLREREERWLAFRDRGEMRTYGEYIGGIAQQFDMQSARRLSPHPFTYGTYQMMAKDGGVCGTMANMGVRTYNTLGIPSCTAGQPGHCALILFAYDPKKSLYECRGGQFATGGPEKTSPHTPYPFGDLDSRKPMVWYQSVAWAVNCGLASYLDSMIAYQMYQALPETDRSEYGIDLLESAVALNPYNIVVADTAMAAAKTPERQIRTWMVFKQAVTSSTSPGCPKDGLYLETIRRSLFRQIESLPVPKDLNVARNVLTFLTENSCLNAEALVSYRTALSGIEAVSRETAVSFREHLASHRTEASCQLMGGTIQAVARRIPEKKYRNEWVQQRWNEIKGHETYFGPKDRLLTDSSATILAKLNKTKVVPLEQRLESALNSFQEEFERHVSSARDKKSCTAFARRIANVAKQIKDPAQSKEFLDGLSKTIAGRESYRAPGGTKADDACASTIQQLVASLNATKKS